MTRSASCVGDPADHLIAPLSFFVCCLFAAEIVICVGLLRCVSLLRSFDVLRVRMIERAVFKIDSVRHRDRKKKDLLQYVDF